MTRPSSTELIDKFVENRWEDAKEALRQLDPEYVEKFENTVRLQRMELETPWTANPSDKPRRRLSKTWHVLLEGCQELVEQTMVLQTSADCLKRESFQNLLPQIAGSRADYHWRSWFIHSVALCERTEAVVRKTLDVYCQNLETKRELRERHVSAIRSGVKEYAVNKRDSYVHANRGSWSRGITKEQLWEGAISISIKPRQQLEQFWLPRHGQRAQNGEHDVFATFTHEIMIRLGDILKALEEDLAAVVSNPASDGNASDQ